MALKGPCVAKDEMPLRRANDVVFKMASAVGVRSEHKVNIDRSKETDRFYCEFTNIRIIMREKKKVECRFQFYAYCSVCFRIIVVT